MFGKWPFALLMHPSISQTTHMLLGLRSNLLSRLPLRHPSLHGHSAAVAAQLLTLAPIINLLCNHYLPCRKAITHTKN